ncbi:DJ-1/PfpI family protein [Fibrella aquatilis]|uniref:DJ-1/PfpI family protein n=1 Tax=Fibrella aquatilis TaxID=2817059 RepID=A0A939JZI1_9BACT|nr:DJ-1/PfpI family protein [Fibrella aquatilis]MBO0931433.1 DJ-1/PfpI family protein [Fibrella aquatilis]
MKKNVLFVVTSHDKKGSTGQPTGYYLAEVAHPWAVLTKAGYTIHFVSPQGGTPPVDGYNLNDPINKAFVDDATAQAGINASLTPAQVNLDQYAAILYAGGHGTMWDFADNTELARIAARIYENGGAVAAVCHGPAGLVNIKLSDGRYLVDGKRVNAFTNEEEIAVKLETVVPFLLESKLIERGAKFEKAGLWQPKVVVDGRLVTGQNPASATSVAEALLQVLQMADLAVEGPATDVMGVSTEQLLNVPDAPNKALRDLLAAPADPTQLAGKRVAIVVTDGVEEIELTFVRTMLQRRGATVHVVSPRKPNYPPRFGAHVPANRDTHISTVKWMQNSGYLKIDRFLPDTKPADYDLVYIPGGAWNPDALRADADALTFIKTAHTLNIPVASLCHGPWVLISAGLVKGRRVTAWWNMHDDLRNAGGTVVDEPLVTDRGLITARGPIDLAPFVNAIITTLVDQKKPVSAGR